MRLKTYSTKHKKKHHLHTKHNKKSIKRRTTKRTMTVHKGTFNNHFGGFSFTKAGKKTENAIEIAKTKLGTALADESIKKEQRFIDGVKPLIQLKPTAKCLSELQKDSEKHINKIKTKKPTDILTSEDVSQIKLKVDAYKIRYISSHGGKSDSYSNSSLTPERIASDVVSEIIREKQSKTPNLTSSTPSTPSYSQHSTQYGTQLRQPHSAYQSQQYGYRR